MIRQIEPWIDEAELVELARVVRSTYVVEAELTAEFEAMTRELTGARHAIAMCNGTMALYACLKAMGIGPGDEVIVPNITFVATSNAVILAGAAPVLCEVREDTFCIDVARAKALLSPRTKAIIPVHLYGQTADMEAVNEFAAANGLKVLEDAAQGVGVRFQGKHAGTFGDMGILSYYGNKTITCGEGGVVLTDNDELAAIAYRLKNHGRSVKGVFVHEHIGFNFSFTEMQAAVGIAQMKKLHRIIGKKQEIRDRYEQGLQDVAGLKPTWIDPRCKPVHWFTSCQSDSAVALAAHLAEAKIQTRKFFYPLHLQPCYSDGKHVPNLRDNFSLSEKIYETGISLPSSFHLTEPEQDLVISEIKRFYADRR
jgi:perosamine synthetase